MMQRHLSPVPAGRVPAGFQRWRGELVGCLALLLTACTQPKPLALVLSVEPIPHEAALRDAGYEVRRVPLPCRGDLTCWAKEPQRVDQFVTDTRWSLAGHRDVLLVGVSRGGYLALRMADFPEVGRIAALSPVTDLSALAEYRGHFAPPLDPALARGRRLYLQIGNVDGRVSTDAALQYARAVMGPGVTVEVVETQGHSLPPPDGLLRWLGR
jgi:pimeloyl-ACP methyl ester carboxylesterase